MQGSTTFQRRRSRFHGESGQTTILVVLALGLFLLGFAGLAVDFTSLWFHRQMAQGAADAACQAGAMNMLLVAEGAGTPTAGFTPGEPFSCSATPGAVPCKYAALNGYTAAALADNVPGNELQVSFPASVDGVTTPPATAAAVAFMRVDLIDRVKVFFSPMITRKPTVDVRAVAVCGVVEAAAPIPIIVLNPTCPHSFQISGSASLKVVGGPNKSVQVNSSNTACAAATINSAGQCAGNGKIDLTQAGFDFNGSTFGVFGAPAAAPSNFLPGTAGSWASPSSPISDPFARVPAPAIPDKAPDPSPVAYLEHGCPDHAGCMEFKPGRYDAPIVVEHQSAIFEPGLYYIKPTNFAGADNVDCAKPGSGCTPGPKGKCRASLYVGTGSVVRPSDPVTSPGDGSGGVTFYLSGSAATGYGSVVITSSGSGPGGHTIDPYNTANVICPGGKPIDSRVGLPASMSGNVLLGPCTKRGTYIGAPGEEIGTGRGLLIFQDRANGDQNGQSSLQGNGGLVLSGTLYAHNCTGTPCKQPPADYNAFLQLQGTPGTGTYVLGEIVADQLNEAGNGDITMQLSPDAILEILKVQLLR
ncbi:MAG TPA: pilus assembly protein TadG-related protein [Clostridia bacterium]|nr:pilus assembly protein TadG-related protein [Clostridia bacterium]